MDALLTDLTCKALADGKRKVPHAADNIASRDETTVDQEANGATDKKRKVRVIDDHKSEVVDEFVQNAEDQQKCEAFGHAIETVKELATMLTKIGCLTYPPIGLSKEEAVTEVSFVEIMAKIPALLESGMTKVNTSTVMSPEEKAKRSSQFSALEAILRKSVEEVAKDPEAPLHALFVEKIAAGSFSKLLSNKAVLMHLAPVSLHFFETTKEIIYNPLIAELKKQVSAVNEVLTRANDEICKIENQRTHEVSKLKAALKAKEAEVKELKDKHASQEILKEKAHKAAIEAYKEKNTELNEENAKLKKQQEVLQQKVSAAEKDAARFKQDLEDAKKQAAAAAAKPAAVSTAKPAAAAEVPVKKDTTAKPPAPTAPASSAPPKGPLSKPVPSKPAPVATAPTPPTISKPAPTKQTTKAPSIQDIVKEAEAAPKSPVEEADQQKESDADAIASKDDLDVFSRLGEEAEARKATAVQTPPAKKAASKAAAPPVTAPVAPAPPPAPEAVSIEGMFDD
jgi:hypothetical protein